MRSRRNLRPDWCRLARRITLTFGLALGVAISLSLAGCTSSGDDDGTGPGPGADARAGSSTDAGNQNNPDAGGGNGLSTQCNALCAHTPSASDLQGDCTAITLSDAGGYLFLEPSCTQFADAFDQGTATVAQCIQCYLDANVASAHCTQAENTCF